MNFLVAQFPPPTSLLLFVATTASTGTKAITAKNNAIGLPSKTNPASAVIGAVNWMATILTTAMFLPTRCPWPHPRSQVGPLSAWADGQGLLFRNGSGGHVSNGLFANVAEGIEIEDKESPIDAFDHYLAGDLTLSNIKMVNCEDALDYDGTDVEDGDAQLDAYAADNGIEIMNGLDID